MSYKLYDTILGLMKFIVFSKRVSADIYNFVSYFVSYKLKTMCYLR